MKKLVSIMLAGFLGITLMANKGCGGDTSSADRQDSATVAAQQEQYGIAQPVPTFDFSLERDIVIQLYQARNERVSTHTVWRSDLGTVEGDCPSIGYPIPYDTSLTNPLTVAYKEYNTGVGVTEQPEPNGVFASKNSIATWVRCLVEQDGFVTETPIYIESKVTAYPYAVTVNYSSNRVVQEVGSTVNLQLQQR